MIYVTSDLHGTSPDTFRQLLDAAGFGEEDFCFVLGDVIDRGDYGVALLRYLMVQPNMQLLLGNHEAMLLSCRFLFDTITEESIEKLTAQQMGLLSHWTENGAQPTLKALSTAHGAVVEDILDYLQDAPLYETVSAGGRDFILTHSGLGGFAPDKRLTAYTADELLWHRPALDERYYEDMTVVFGHTPTGAYGTEHAGRILFTDTWINVDVGAGTGHPPALLRLDDLQTFYLE